jgi:hypothetical protein
VRKWREYQHTEEDKKQAIKLLGLFKKMANKDPEWGVQKPDSSYVMKKLFVPLFL